MSEPVWVRQDVVLSMHEEALQLHGGAEGVRDLGLLESALTRPKNLYAYSEQAPTLARLAASYAKGIVVNHPFVDGNKRTAFIVSVTFLSLNGLQLTATKEDRVLIFWALAAGEISEEQLARWFEEKTADTISVKGKLLFHILKANSMGEQIMRKVSNREQNSALTQVRLILE